MALDPTRNFAKVEVDGGFASGVTSITLVSGDGAKLPDPATDGDFNLSWWNFTDSGDPADDSDVEIVRVTARSTDVLTVTRAQEGTADVNHNTGGKTYKMVLSPTKKMIDDIDAAGAGVPNITISSDISDTNRNQANVAASGVAGRTIVGLAASSGSTISGHAGITARVGLGSIHEGSRIFKTIISIQTVGSDGTFFAGSGDFSSTFIFVTGTFQNTNKHIGFKGVRVSSGSYELFATQADGTTENVSAALTTMSAADVLFLIWISDGTNVDYHFAKNDGAISAATRLTANYPAVANEDIMIGVANDDVATTMAVNFHGWEYGLKS